MHLCIKNIFMYTPQKVWYSTLSLNLNLHIVYNFYYFLYMTLENYLGFKLYTHWNFKAVENKLRIPFEFWIQNISPLKYVLISKTAVLNYFEIPWVCLVKDNAYIYPVFSIYSDLRIVPRPVTVCMLIVCQCNKQHQ